MFCFLHNKSAAVSPKARLQRTLWQITWRASLVLTLLIMPLPAAASAFEQPAPVGAVDSQLPNGVAPNPTSQRALPFVPGEILVGIRADSLLSASKLSSASMQFSADIEPCPPTSLGELSTGSRDADMDDAPIVTKRFLTPEGMEWETIEQLRADPAVAFAEPNWIVQAADWFHEAAQTDQEQQAGEAQQLAAGVIETPYLVNDPLYEETQWYMQRINASRAWALAEAAGVTASSLAPIRVSIIDSGIDATHPDLQNRIAASENYVTPGSAATDDYGHGTHVAGLIGAALNNGIGIAGPAPQVTYDVRKVLDDRGQGSITNVAQGIKDATDADAKIINLSLQIGTASTVMHNCIKYAYSRGVLLIGAVGNFFPSPVQWPAAFPEVFAVAATGYDDTHASYSDIGEEVEIAAPGGDAGHSLLSTWSKNENAKKKCPSLVGGLYCANRGTSMAAGIVSGVAALVWSIQPSLTAEEVRALLKQTATQLDADPTEVGRGRLDALAAVRLALPGDLQLVTDHSDQPLALGADPFEVTLRMDNSSLAAATWRATVANTPWLTSTSKLSGTVRYGAPASVTLTVSPTHLATGRYNAPIQIVATLANSEQITKSVNIGLTIGEDFTNYYFPTVFQEGRSVVVADTSVDFTWETDILENRDIFGAFDSRYITLPFTITLKGQEILDGWLHANGLISFPGTGATGASLPTSCLPTADWPQQAVFGWWSDLDASSTGAQISTFQPGSNRVVYEYLDVSIGSSDEKVSFQIVLYENGRIGLNYLHTPSTLRAEFEATVGVSLLDSRFYNQVGCKDQTREIGLLPQSGQSLVIEPEDIY